MRVLLLAACVVLLAAPVSADFDFDGNPYPDPWPDDGSTFPAPVAPRVQVFDNQADFLNAAGNVTTQDFEDEATTGDCDSGAAGELVFADFSAASTPDAMKVVEVPCYGNHNTTPGGAKYLAADTDVGGVSAQVTFTFDPPIRALGLYLIDFEMSAQLVILGTSYPIQPNGNGGESYFGIIEGVEFSSVVVQIVENADSHYSFDDISYGPGLTPVEDSTWGEVKALYR